MITGQFDIDNIRRAINPVGRHLGACGVCVAQTRVHSGNESLSAISPQNRLLGSEKHFSATLHHFSYNNRAEITYLLVRIVKAPHRTLYAGAASGRKEVEQKSAHFTERYYFQLVGILEVHYLIADIVGGLHDVDERMSRENARREFRNAKLRGHPAVDFLFALKKSELSFAS